MEIRTWLALGLLLGSHTLALAGRSCEQLAATPAQVQAAATMAATSLAALEQAEVQTALIARVGSDLSRFDLTYSHIAIVSRTPAQPWRVTHLLNHCGTSQSQLYEQGLFNFFLDDLFRHQALIVYLDRDTAEQVQQLLESPDTRSLHEPRYNMIANPKSKKFQNSNQWLLELMAVAMHKLEPQRKSAQERLYQTGYQPEILRIGRLERVFGGLTQANLNFSDHPLGTRLSSRYPVVSVRSIIAYLNEQDVVSGMQEITLDQSS